MLAFVGAGSSDESVLSECLDEAVELLSSYVRHLRVIEAGAVVGQVAAAHDEGTSTYTWTDTRVLAVDDLAGPVPATVLDRCTREVCSDLFARRNAPNGIVNQQFAGPDGPSSAPARLHRDPLVPAYPLLGRWAVPF
jgi:hypothetical protein